MTPPAPDAWGKCREAMESYRDHMKAQHGRGSASAVATNALAILDRHAAAGRAEVAELRKWCEELERRHIYRCDDCGWNGERPTTTPDGIIVCPNCRSLCMKEPELRQENNDLIDMLETTQEALTELLGLVPPDCKPGQMTPKEMAAAIKAELATLRAEAARLRGALIEIRQRIYRASSEVSAELCVGELLDAALASEGGEKVE